MMSMFKGMRLMETLWLNVLRGVAAGVVWMFVLLVVRPPDMSLSMILTYPIVIPCAVLFLFPLFWAFLHLMDSIGIPCMGLGQLLLALLVMPGDALVWLLQIVFPPAVPVASYDLITPSPFIVVTGAMLGSRQAESAPGVACPFTGRVLADRDTRVMGFDWSSKETIFTIHPDWRVATPQDTAFGWIDKNGSIHRGRPCGDIDPAQTLCGDVIATLSGAGLYVGNQKVGELVK